MDKNDKISLVIEINRYIAANSSSIWPGFAAVPYILYDNENQVASGEKWPNRYIQVPEQKNIWVAEGYDPQLMGNTAISYHGMQVAIWDTRTWPAALDVSKAAGCIAHEMFHVFQQVNMALLWPNELLLPQYPHNARSVALVMAENKLLADLLAHPDTKITRSCLERIALLRKLREIEIGADYFEYDKRCESYEGTAAYVEMRMNALINENAHEEVVASYLALLTDNNHLLANYRHRCYAAGLVLCLAADVLRPGWQIDWTKSKDNLYDWIMSKLLCTELETEQESVSESTSASASAPKPVSTPVSTSEAASKPKLYMDPCDLTKASECLSTFQQDNASKINAFLAQPLVAIEGSIQLLKFDPMNLTCADGFCLHKQGALRLGDNTHRVDTPFLAEYGDTILAIKRIFLPKAVHWLIPLSGDCTSTEVSLCCIP